MSASRTYVLSLRAGQILASVLTGGACWAAPALAEVDFNIPAGPLASTLLQIARDGDTVVSFAPELVDGLRAPAIRGRFTMEQALHVALEGNRLGIDVTTGGVVTIRALPQDTPTQNEPVVTPENTADSPANMAVLPPVEVLGSGRPRDESGLKGLRVASSTRGDTPLSELPQSVSVLTSDALALQGGATTLEALRYVTGVNEAIDILGSGGLSLPEHQIRGFTASYALSGMPTIRIGIPADNAFIDRIEIPKGPSGIIAGFAGRGGELGGVINLVRKQAGPGQQQQVSQSIGSADGGTLHVSADVGGELADQTYWRTVGYASQSGRTEGGYTGQKSGGLLGSMSYRRSDLNAVLTVQADARRYAPSPASRGGLRVNDTGGIVPAPLEDGLAPPLDPNDRIWSRFGNLALEVDWRLSPQWKLNWTGRAEATDSDLRRRAPFTLPVNRRNRAWSQAMQAGLLGSLETAGVQHRVLLGLDLEHRHVLDTGVSNLLQGRPEQTYSADLSDFRQVFLLQDQISVGQLRLRLLVQRAQIPESEFMSSLFNQSGAPVSVKLDKLYGTNWDLGALYHLTPSASVYAGAQSTLDATRIPSSAAKLADGSAPAPAYMRQVQGGTKLEWPDQRMTLTVEAYRTRQLDRPLFFPPIFYQVPGRYVSGLDIEVSGRPQAALDINLGLSLMRGITPTYRLGTDTVAPQAVDRVTPGLPSRSMNFLARYRLSDDVLPDTRLGLGFRATSSTLVGPTSNAALGHAQDFRLPGGGLLDLSLERSFGSWALTGFVNNVFDRRQYATSYDLTYLPLQPRRNFVLTATYKE